jgi:uncharacterized membrane protein
LEIEVEACPLLSAVPQYLANNGREYARNLKPSEDMPMRIESAGHAVFAATMIGVGILGLIKGDFTAVWQPVFKGLPASQVLAYLCALICVACGLGLLWQRTAALSARVFLVYLLLYVLVLRVPGLLHGLPVDVYWSLSQTGVLVAAAWVLYAWFAGDWDRQRFSFATGDKGLRIARALYGVAIIPFGIAHFQYLEHTASMVPNWLPAHVAWAYFTGWAFIAGGVAILIGACARLAAALSALMMGLFLALVWIPALATRPLNKFEWGEVLVNCVLTAAGWVVADSYRGTPWFAGRRARAAALVETA